MSFSEVANELIKNYLQPGATERQLAAFQTHFAPKIIEKLKAKYDGKNVSEAALLNDKEFTKLIPDSF